MLRRHRARLSQSATLSEGEAPTGGSFGPRQPYNELALEMCDREAQWVGDLARYALRFGILEPEEINLNGFWWIRGRCKGIRAGTLDNEQNIQHIAECCKQLASKAEYLDTLETRFSILDRARAIREASLKMFPSEKETWLTLEEAAQRVSRSQRTVKNWLSAGMLKTLDERWGLMIQEQSVVEYAQAMDRANKRPCDHRSY